MSKEMLTFNEFAKALFENRIVSISDIGAKDIVEVASSCLTEVQYDLEKKVLTVTFVESGASYSYFGVSESDYEAVVHASSVGKAYNSEIKENYPYLRVGI